jgi:ankyrin repeat protein
MQACAQGAVAVARALLEAGANVNLMTTKGLTALMLASSKNNVDLVELLLQHHADVNAVNSVSAVHLCACQPRVPASKSVPAQLGYSALTIAIEQDQKGVALALVRAGANVNLKNKVRVSVGGVGLLL